MSPRLRFALVTMSAVLAATATFSLGRWQLSRAAEKERLQQLLDQREAMPALDVKTLVSGAKSAGLLDRRVVVTGRWQVDATVYLENRQMNGRAGFFVVTPLLLDEGGKAILVQRGWAPRDLQDRSRLPRVETGAGAVRLEGRIVPHPSRVYELGASEPGPIRQNLEVASYAAETGLSLLPVAVQQVGSPSEGLLRDWPRIGAGIEKHYGYAFQWFGLSALVVLLYVWFQIVRRFFRRRER